MTTTAPPETRRAHGAKTMGRRPWRIWIVPSVALYVVLIARNTFLFSTRLYEQGDSGANSILIEQALRFRLLVGHYSREGFNHPGPAYMYIQAAGEWVARDLLHVVPTAWNGQWLAVFALNSVFAALVVGVVYGWTRSSVAAAASFAVVLGFEAVHSLIVHGNWMPDLLIMPFFVFLLASASVAAGQGRDVWVLTLSGWLLIHGHVCFLFFVPAITAVTVVLAVWPARRHPFAAVRRFVRGSRSSWIPSVVISAAFILPIAVNLIVRWPGDFGKYFSYGGSGKAGGHSFGQVVSYALWFWWPHGSPIAIAVLVVLLAASVATVLAFTRGQLRRCLLMVIVISVAASLAFLTYAAVGIDRLNEFYIGYFYWAVPGVLVLTIVIALASPRTPVSRTATALAVAGAAGALTAFAFGVNVRANLHDNDPGLPAAVATVAASSRGRLIVIGPRDVPWAEVTGFLVQAERTGVRVCVNQPAARFLVTSQFVCTSYERHTGVRYEFLASAPPARAHVIVRFGTASEGYATVIRG